MAEPVARLAWRTCPLCEASCGLELGISESEQIVRVRGDAQHVMSRGYLCPKGASFGRVMADPQRLRRPLVKANGEWVETSWDDALAVARDGFSQLRERHGDDAVATYLGNPTGHTISGGFVLRWLVESFRSRNRFTASTLDQMPMHLACGLLFGNAYAIPVPDLDRTDLLVVVGANPVVSNGSLCTAPDFPARLRALRGRGGRLVVVDPVRTKTAELADDHLQVRPGSDALWLLAVIHVLFDDGLVRLGVPTSGVDELKKVTKRFSAEAVEAAVGVPASQIRRLAHWISDAPSAAVYGRLGTCSVASGTLTSALITIVNVLTGNLDTPGGAMFALASDAPAASRSNDPPFVYGRWHSRVQQLPEILGELPTATLLDEIETPGPGQVRALLTVGGNPALSAPNSDRWHRALPMLEHMVSVDPYLNETTKHATVILPPDDLARVPHFDRTYPAVAVHNFAAYSPEVFEPHADGMDESSILLRLIARDVEPDEYVEQVVMRRLRASVAAADSAVAGRDPLELRALLTGTSALERLVDLQVRLGAYGDQLSPPRAGLSLERLKASPHGVDLGPLTPRLPQLIRTPSGRVELAAPELLGAIDAQVDEIPAARPQFVLVGRRELRSHNSWLHNTPALVNGKERCTLHMRPDDAEALGLTDGETARVHSRTGTLDVRVELDPSMRGGVVSLPHGWGHDVPGTDLTTSALRPGVNVNRLTDEQRLDDLSGTAAYNAIPVSIVPVRAGSAPPPRVGDLDIV